MFDMLIDSFKLFFQGKLFQDNGQFWRQALIGGFIAVAVILALALLVNLWLGAILGGLVAGAQMPLLFKNLKYR